MSSMNTRDLPTRPALAVVLAVAAALAGPARADGSIDHQRARAAMLAGEIRPLGDILQRLHPRLGGDVIAIELEREDGRWVYEFKVLQPGGRIVEWYVDARDGSVLQRKVKREKGRP